MVVKTQRNGREVTGLRVGAANVRRYFSRNISAVRLHLGDLEIECELAPEFWRGKPEIHDLRLIQWLEFRTHQQEAAGIEPISLAMVQSGRDSFKLQSLASRG